MNIRGFVHEVDRDFVRCLGNDDVDSLNRYLFGRFKCPERLCSFSRKKCGNMYPLFG